MANIIIKGHGSVEELIKDIDSFLTGNSISCESVYECIEEKNGVKIILSIYEKYYMRVKNRLSLSILIIGYNKELTVNLISSGGGNGLFSGLSWGAEENFVDSLATYLESLGFIVEDDVKVY